MIVSFGRFINKNALSKTRRQQFARPQDVCFLAGYVPVPGFVLLCLLSIFCLSVPAAFSQTAQSRFVLKWTADPKMPRRVAVEVSGLNAADAKALRQTQPTQAEWQKILSVFVKEGMTPNAAVPPMLGTYRVVGNTLRFEPQFPLQPNITYRAEFHPELLPNNRTGKTAPSYADFALKVAAPKPTTTVTHIYPSASVLPENLLKFYIEFSAPMSRGQIYEHIQLRDADRNTIELPFLEINEELWDTTRKRLTLFLDPGRIKRGVLPLEEIGSSLQAGKRYTLTIEKTWKDANDAPLKAAYTKTFQVKAADRMPLDPARWTLHAPKSGSRSPLIVLFPEPLDHALAQRMIRVTDTRGKPIPGIITLWYEESRLTFLPQASWRRGAYRLVIQTALEDLAGNNVGKPFDVDLTAKGQRHLTSPTVQRSFSVR